MTSPQPSHNPRRKVSDTFGADCWRMFKAGNDTMQIATLHGVPEWTVYNAIHRFRCRKIRLTPYAGR